MSPTTIYDLTFLSCLNTQAQNLCLKLSILYIYIYILKPSYDLFQLWRLQNVIAKHRHSNICYLDLGRPVFEITVFFVYHMLADVTFGQSCSVFVLVSIHDVACYVFSICLRKFDLREGRPSPLNSESYYIVFKMNLFLCSFS